MVSNNKRVAISWTGGKDSTLALHRVAAEAANKIVALVTFQPKNADFRAHPISFQDAQAKALNLPRIGLVVDPDAHNGNYRLAYAACLKQLRQEHNIDVIVTGDMDLVGTMKRNFITECCEIADCGIICWLPLWKANREEIMKELLETKIDACMTCVKSPCFDETWIGHQITENSLQQFYSVRQQYGLDLCGENGEYHTCVVDAPMFQQRIDLQIKSSSDNDDVTLYEELVQQKGQKNQERWWVMNRNVKPVLVRKS